MPLTHQDRFRVQFKTRPNERPTYSIQLECQFESEGQWYAVIRANDFHDRPHLDILSPSGEENKKVWLSDQMDNKMNMKEAKRFLDESWEKERQRYEQQLEQYRQQLNQ
ncbi:DUF7718 family protein [Funiculus sociatus]|uniref:DUF7718 family protein n=1 Tax=Funiculus sociatus TaxID=450527 RepID=UPI003D65E89D